MASAGKESFKQDLVVSIRYRNELPPPPMPPKFLDIDTGGISQYLTTSYASGIARREEPNIDVDAEGGMPIDMIGISGYFLGDESAIMAPDTLPLLDPADQALMLSVEQLKSKGARDNVSFLRKNQYLSAVNAPTTSRLLGNPRVQKTINKTAPAPVDRNDKENIKKYIQRGFDIAYDGAASQSDREAWREPQHPDNPRLKPVAFYPILPDLETGTDVSNWGRVKFEKPPLPARNGKRDDRVDSALFMALQNKTAAEQWQAAKAAFEANPKAYEDPGPIPPYTYIMTLPANPEHTSSVRKALFEGNPDTNPPENLFEESEDGTPRIPFTKARVYTTVEQTQTAANRFMALGLYNPSSPTNAVPPSKTKHKQGPAAYFYPIAENIKFKTDRSKLSKPSRSDADDEEMQIDRMMVARVPPNAAQKAERVAFRGRFDSAFKTEWDELDQDAQQWREAQEREAAQAAAAQEQDHSDNDDGRPDAEMESDDDDGRHQNGANATKANGNGNQISMSRMQDIEGASPSPAGTPESRDADAMDDD